jgi:hypothetical protein
MFTGCSRGHMLTDKYSYSSVIVTHLLRMRDLFKDGNANTYICYLYLSYKERETQTFSSLFGSVVRQLAEHYDQLPASLVVAWKKAHKQGSRPPTQADLSALFADLTKDRNVYIVLDGLDESLPNTRADVLKALQPEGTTVSLLITSRILPDFKELSEGFPKSEIKANPRDLNLFINHKFDSESRLRQHAKQDPELRDDVKFAVEDKCKGM